jgi:isopentenyldiphosphate isomerase
MDYKWVSIKSLQKDIKNYPEKYTPWMKLIIEKGLFDESSNKDYLLINNI